MNLRFHHRWCVSQKQISNPFRWLKWFCTSISSVDHLSVSYGWDKDPRFQLKLVISLHQKFWIWAYTKFPCLICNCTMYLTAWLLWAFSIFVFYVIVRFFIKFNRRKQRILKYVGHLSSPKGYPIIGSCLKFFRKSTQGELILKIQSSEMFKTKMVKLPTDDVINRKKFIKIQKNPFFCNK